MSSPLAWHRKRIQHGMHYAAEVILDMVMEEGVITVTNVMLKGAQESLQNSASIYTQLKWLRDKGFIKVTQEEEDNRIKNCSVTTKGMKYLGLI
jgi:DNA-binding MarR family transcriptional regulator